MLVQKVTGGARTSIKNSYGRLRFISSNGCSDFVGKCVTEGTLERGPFRYMTAPCCHKFWNPSPSSFLRLHHNGHPVMTKRKADTDKNIQDPTPNKSKKPKVPKITLESDPTISPDHVKISGLLSQKKTWRSVPSKSI